MATNKTELLMKTTLRAETLTAHRRTNSILADIKVEIFYVICDIILDGVFPQVGTQPISRASTMPELTVRYSDLDFRRRELGMSYRILANLSGLSLQMVQRLLTAHNQSPRFLNVMAVVTALGNGIPRVLPDGSCKFEFAMTALELRRLAATRKARRLVDMVQGTSALEGQAISKARYDEMVEQTCQELLAGSNHRLWSD